MTYTFKLSRRVALLRVGASLAAALLCLSCAADEGPSGPGGSSTDPRHPGLTITPDAADVGVDGSVQFTAETTMDRELTTSAAKGGKGKGRGRGNSGGDLSVSPASVTLEPNTVQRFTAAQTLADGSTIETSIKWSATGGTVDSTGRYTAGRTPGQYRVVATTSSGLADTAAATVVAESLAVDRVVLSPATASLIVGATQQFTAVGKASDGSTVSITPAYSAKGGTVTAAGLYTAGQTAGTYRVIATDPTSGKADTSAVTIATASPSLQALVLTPASVSLAPSGSQQFAASGKMSDGSTAPVTATFAATGGTISSTGLYTAGSTAGTFRVIATQSGGTLTDTAAVAITAPSSSPTSGTTYFLADAESGTIVPPWLSWGVYGLGGAKTPVTSTTRAKNGTRSFKFEVVDPSISPFSSSTLATNSPQSSMGCPDGHFCSGWYSVWLYVDAGWDNPSWNVLMNFQASRPTTGDPIGHVNLSPSNGVLQLYWDMKNCQVGHYACPNIAGYQNTNGDYRMTASSPAGIVAFPKNQWVHLAVYYKMARTNGQVQIWQNGVKIMDLTASTFNTLDGHRDYNNTGGDLGVIALGIYHGPNADASRRMYADDYRVSNYRPLP